MVAVEVLIAFDDEPDAPYWVQCAIGADYDADNPPVWDENVFYYWQDRAELEDALWNGTSHGFRVLEIGEEVDA